MNSKSEWHQAKVVRTTTQVVQGGADAVRELGRDHEGGGDQGGAEGQEPGHQEGGLDGGPGASNSIF